MPLEKTNQWKVDSGVEDRAIAKKHGEVKTYKASLFARAEEILKSVGDEYEGKDFDEIYEILEQEQEQARPEAEAGGMEL